MLTVSAVKGSRVTSVISPMTNTVANEIPGTAAHVRSDPKGKPRSRATTAPGITNTISVAMPPGVTYVQSPPREVLVDEIYNRSAVFVCSSLREGFGLGAIEAMAGGCALVTTANGGSEEYAIPGETGLVCAPRDVAGMAERIERLIRDDALRVRVATAGRALVQERYDWDRSARELEQYLEGYAEATDASWSDAV